MHQMNEEFIKFDRSQFDVKKFGKNTGKKILRNATEMQSEKVNFYG